MGFVKATEPAIAELEEASARAGGPQSPPPGVDVRQMEHVVRQFSTSWKQAMDRIYHYIMASFTNFSNGMEILKQVLTQLLVYYTRLQKIINRSFPQQPPGFTRELVATTTILG